MLISVCIPTVRPDTLAHTISAVQGQSHDDWELLVVAQGGDTRLREATDLAAGGDRRVRYLHLPERGLSRARNHGIAQAQGEVVAMTDDDCEPAADWLATIAEAFAADPELGVVGGALRGEDPSLRRLSTCLVLEPEEVRYDPRVTPPPAPAGFEWFGANVAFRRTVLHQVGPFDVHLGVGGTFHSAEDVDYKHRLELAGVPMLSTPRSVVHHTYGQRHGLRNVVRYWRNQDIGAGAVAAKFTLCGDPRGPEWHRAVLREYTLGLLREPRPQRLVSYPVRLQAFTEAYRRCLRGFRVDDQTLLVAR